MKAVKDRMRKVNLFVSTNVQVFSGAGPDEPPTPQPSRAGTAPRARGWKRRPQKRITRASGGDLAGLYDIGGCVAKSAHPGVEVLFGRRRCNGEQVVIKTREKSSFKGAQEERKWRKTTVAQLNMPKNDSMCEYFAVYETWEKYFVVMERVRGMDLFEHLQQGHVDQEGVRQVLFQMLGALKAMHASGRIHKDLKLESVVVDLSSLESPTKVCRVSSNGSRTSVVAKLIGFDNVEDWKPSSAKAKDVLGTPGYIAPEAYSGDYSPASDVYSVGVTMYRLLTGRSPSRLAIFAHPSGDNRVGSPAMQRMRDRLSLLEVEFERPPLNRMPDAQDLVKKMMAVDASGRPSAAEALEHPWFTHAGGGRWPSRASTSAGSSPASSSESLRSASSSAPATKSSPRPQSILARARHLGVPTAPTTTPPLMEPPAPPRATCPAAETEGPPEAEEPTLPGVPE